MKPPRILSEILSIASSVILCGFLAGLFLRLLVVSFRFAWHLF